VNAVYPDDFVSAKQLTEEMLRLGHRRIAFANLNHHPALSSPDHYSFDDRRDGYCSALSAAGLAPIYVGDEAGEMPFAERLAFAKAWLRNPERPTALIGYNEHATMPFLVAAQALGLTIPSDLSLATFSVNPPDTTGMFMGISQMTFHAIGVAAVDLVVKRIASAGEDQPSQSFAGTYRPGDTVGPPRR
jgi:LacI family transcriptional regulator